MQEHTEPGNKKDSQDDMIQARSAKIGMMYLSNIIYYIRNDDAGEPVHEDRKILTRDFCGRSINAISTYQKALANIRRLTGKQADIYCFDSPVNSGFMNFFQCSGNLSGLPVKEHKQEHGLL